MDVLDKCWDMYLIVFLKYTGHKYNKSMKG